MVKRRLRSLHNDEIACLGSREERVAKLDEYYRAHEARLEAMAQRALKLMTTTLVSVEHIEQ